MNKNGSFSMEKKPFSDVKLYDPFISNSNYLLYFVYVILLCVCLVFQAINGKERFGIDGDCVNTVDEIVY